MAQTQQHDKLDTLDGADLANKIGWATVGDGGATTGNFTMYNSGSVGLSNNIVGAYHKPANAATKTAANIARAFLNAGAGGILTETELSVCVNHRISSDVNGSSEGWPTGGVSGSDVVFGVILRASGTAYATHNWYEIGFVALSGQSTGTLRIRKNLAGTNTDLASVSIALPFKYPAYSEASSPANTPANLWAKVTGHARNSGGNVILDGIVTIQLPGGGGMQVTVGPVTDSTNPVTAAGYGGFWTSGNASASGTLWSHFSEFLLTVNAGGEADPQDPTDANTMPALTAEPTLTSITVLKEQDSATVVETLPLEPHFYASWDLDWATNETKTVAGYVITQAKYPNARRAWQLHWDAMSNADLATLKAFFTARVGNKTAFSWTPPFYATPIKMIFVEGAFEDEYLAQTAERVNNLIALEVFAS